MYSSESEFVDLLAPFLQEAVDAGEPAFAALTAERRDAVAERLGAAANGVTFFHAPDWYATPGRALLAFAQEFDKAIASGATQIRAIGEPPVGSDVGREERWTRYEGVFNRLFTGNDPVWLICPYDARTVGDAGLACCRQTHPTVLDAGGRNPNPEFFAATRHGPVFSVVDGAGGEETSGATARSPEELVELRRAVVWPARRAGLRLPDAQDLALAVTEMARAAFARGASGVAVRTAAAADLWFCEVSLGAVSASSLASDAGRIGLAIGSIVADRIELGDGRDAGHVRFVFTSQRRGPRERIVDAATTLFGRNGVRATTVNAIVAEAGVAKATFYDVFPSKDDLLATWTVDVVSQWADGLRIEAEARADSPHEAVLAWFDALGEWLDLDLDTGLALLRAISELRYPSHPSRQEKLDSLDSVRRYLLGRLEAAGAHDPARLTQQLLLLSRGAVAEAGDLESSEPVRVAAATAAALVAAALPPS